jgi:hypothetical protein
MQAFPWTPAQTLTNETVSLLILAQFPSLAPARVTARYQGWDNEAVEINGEWIFRFPKRADGKLPLKRELALLSRLSTVLSVRIAAVHWPADVLACRFQRQAHLAFTRRSADHGRNRLDRRRDRRSGL